MKTKTTTIIGLALAAMALSGCSQGSDTLTPAKATETPTATSTPTTSETASPAADVTPGYQGQAPMETIDAEVREFVENGYGNAAVWSGTKTGTKAVEGLALTGAAKTLATSKPGTIVGMDLAAQGVHFTKAPVLDLKVTNPAKGKDGATEVTYTATMTFTFDDDETGEVFTSTVTRVQTLSLTPSTEDTRNWWVSGYSDATDTITDAVLAGE